MWDKRKGIYGPKNKKIKKWSSSPSRIWPRKRKRKGERERERKNKEKDIKKKKKEKEEKKEEKSRKKEIFSYILFFQERRNRFENIAYGNYCIPKVSKKEERRSKFENIGPDYFDIPRYDLQIESRILNFYLIARNLLVKNRKFQINFVFSSKYIQEFKKKMFHLFFQVNSKIKITSFQINSKSKKMTSYFLK